MFQGRVLYPATGYLALVWETMGMVKGQPYTEIPIVFENVKFHRATNIPKDGRIYLVVMVQKVSGNFEVSIVLLILQHYECEELSIAKLGNRIIFQVK